MQVSFSLEQVSREELLMLIHGIGAMLTEKEGLWTYEYCQLFNRTALLLCTMAGVKEIPSVPDNCLTK